MLSDLNKLTALPLLGISPQIWGFPTRSRGLGFFLRDLGFFLGFFKTAKIFSTKAAFFKKNSIFSRKSLIFSRKSSIFPQNLYKFDLGFSGDFSVARLGFSIFLEWQHCCPSPCDLPTDSVYSRRTRNSGVFCEPYGRRSLVTGHIFLRP